MNFVNAAWDMDLTGDTIHSSFIELENSRVRDSIASLKCTANNSKHTTNMSTATEHLLRGANKKAKRICRLKKKTRDTLLTNERKHKRKVNKIVEMTMIEKSSEVSEIKSSCDLRTRMLERLGAARFRYLNQSLYESDGAAALRLFKRDPAAHEAYHRGYRAQVSRWPLNPLDAVAAAVSRLPQSHVVADFGCGDAGLARSVSQRVHSFDLAGSSLPEAAGLVHVCDMSHVPLRDGSVDVAVFCLSLMGTNLRDYLLEANRVLRPGGLLLLAEVASRFGAVHDFVLQMKCFGFQNTRTDLSHNLFYFLDFTKERNIRKRSKLPQITLKPCLYKKR